MITSKTTDTKIYTDNDIDHKCDQIMTNLLSNIELSHQIGHVSLYNIFLTIFILLQHISEHELDLVKISSVCQKIYNELNPKETGHTIN